MRWSRSLVGRVFVAIVSLNGRIVAGDAGVKTNTLMCMDAFPGYMTIIENPANERCKQGSGYSLISKYPEVKPSAANEICAVASCRTMYTLFRGLNVTDASDCLIASELFLYRGILEPLSTSTDCVAARQLHPNDTSSSSYSNGEDGTIVAPPAVLPAGPRGKSVEREPNTALIIGIVVGGVVAIAGIVAGVYWVKSRRQREEELDKLVDDPKNDGNDSPNTFEGTAPLTSPVHLYKASRASMPTPSAPTASIAYRPIPSAPTASRNSMHGPSAPTASLTQLPNPSAPTATQSVFNAAAYSASLLDFIVNDDVLLAHHMRAEDIEDIRVIGSGGHGIVYLVGYRDTRLLASKRLVQDRITTPKLLAFIDEIKLVSTLEHPCIVPFVGVAWTNESDLQALFEYMPNGDLCTHLAKTMHQATWNTSKLQMALDVIHALVYVHSFSPPLVHRDLKSRNVLLDANMRAKLSDFGVSRFQSDALTMTTGVGTSRWLAPEVINGGGTYDERCDVYSFGMVLVELDTHNLPFAGLRNAARNPMHEMTMLQLVSEGKLQPTFRSSCPKSILTIAHQCLAYNPTLRPSAIEVAFALRTIATDEFHFDPLH